MSLFSSTQSQAEQVFAGIGEEPAGLSKSQLIDQIMALNPTATTGFLDAFQESGLRDYLDHLLALQVPRGREASWVRRNETRAIVEHEPAE